MSSSILVLTNELREIDATTLIADWQLIPKYSGGSGLFDDGVITYWFDNQSDKAIYVSFDGGTTSHHRIPAYGYFSEDVAANQSAVGGDSFLKAGLGVFVKHAGVVPTTGCVTFSSRSRKE